jgi:hypothetical protein
MPYRREVPDGEAAIGQLERRGVSPPSPARYRYYTYGLQLSSWLRLPELSLARPGPKPDIEVLPAGLQDAMEGAACCGPWLQVAEERCQILVPGIARYRVEQGRRILIDRRLPREPDHEVSAGDVRLYLFGAALGALLHQRHWLPLHVSALQTPSGVWAFTGHSGAGKSTLGAWLHHALGWPMVSDDVAVIKPEDEQPYLYAGPPRLKLWKDALTALGIERRGLVRDLTRADKYHLRLHQGFQMEPQPLRALVILERGATGEPARLEPITGVAAFQAVMSSLYRYELGRSFTSPARLLRDGARLADQIKVYRFYRSWSLDEMENNIEPLVQRIMQGE